MAMASTNAYFQFYLYMVLDTIRPGLFIKWNCMGDVHDKRKDAADLVGLITNQKIVAAS
jgi:hypothetical protein